MSIKIDKDEAYNLLQLAYNKSKELTKNDKEGKLYAELKNVLLGSHLTYRYILFTGILGKALNIKINPLCLQASAEVSGAYDARSLCHDVIIKKGFERDYLNNNLGASNEPFLNKPARYQMHSTENPVRGGNDKKLQVITFDILNYLNNQKNESKIFYILCLAIDVILSKETIEVKLNNESCYDISEIVNKILDLNTNGESCACAVGAALMLLSSNMGWDVKVHPVNQAGSSSKEVLDIDIYKENKAVIALEIKDKTYSSSDILHAVDKCLHNNITNMTFVTGNKSSYNGTTDISQIIKISAQKGCIVSFMSAKDLITSYLCISGNDFDLFVKNLNHCLKITRSKDTTIKSIKQILEL